MCYSIEDTVFGWQEMVAVLMKVLVSLGGFLVYACYKGIGSQGNKGVQEGYGFHHLWNFPY